LWHSRLALPCNHGAYNQLIIPFSLLTRKKACCGSAGTTNDAKKKHTTNGKLSKTGQESKTCPKHELLRNLMTWHDGKRMLPPGQWQLALTHVVAAWLKADKTKTGQRVFRKDKLKKAGWVVHCGGGDMNQESSLEDSYADLVVAHALE